MLYCENFYEFMLHAQVSTAPSSMTMNKVQITNNSEKTVQC